MPVQPHWPRPAELPRLILTRWGGSPTQGRRPSPEPAVPLLVLAAVTCPLWLTPTAVAGVCLLVWGLAPAPDDT